MCLGSGVGHVVLDELRIGVAHHLGPTLLADVFGAVADQTVTLARHAGLNFSRRSDLEALLAPDLVFNFGILLRSVLRAPSSERSRYEQPWHALGQAVL
jgi:hypothetical protein